jgi:hypothetical protein
MKQSFRPAFIALVPVAVAAALGATSPALANANIKISGQVNYRILKADGKPDDMLAGVAAKVGGEFEYSIPFGETVKVQIPPATADADGKYTLTYKMPAAALGEFTTRTARITVGGALSDDKDRPPLRTYDNVPVAGVAKDNINYLAQKCPCLPPPYAAQTPKYRTFHTYKHAGTGKTIEVRCSNTSATGDIISVTKIAPPMGGAEKDVAIGRCVYPEGFNQEGWAAHLPDAMEFAKPKYHVHRCYDNAATFGAEGMGAPAHDLAIYVFQTDPIKLVRIKAKSKIEMMQPKYKEVGTRKEWTHAQLTGFASLLASYTDLMTGFAGAGVAGTVTTDEVFQSVRYDRVRLVSGPCEAAIRWSVPGEVPQVPPAEDGTIGTMSAPPPTLEPGDGIVISDLPAAAITSLAAGFSAEDGPDGLRLTLQTTMSLHSDDVLLEYDPDKLGFTGEHAPSSYFIADRSATDYWDAIMAGEELDEDPLNRPDGASGAGQIQLGGPSTFGDLDCDGDVDGIDLALLLGDWGRCADGRACRGDLNRDGVVNGFDLSILLANWG